MRRVAEKAGWALVGTALGGAVTYIAWATGSMIGDRVPLSGVMLLALVVVASFCRSNDDASRQTSLMGSLFATVGLFVSGVVALGSMVRAIDSLSTRFGVKVGLLGLALASTALAHSYALRRYLAVARTGEAEDGWRSVFFTAWRLLMPLLGPVTVVLATIAGGSFRGRSTPFLLPLVAILVWTVLGWLDLLLQSAWFAGKPNKLVSQALANNEEFARRFQAVVPLDVPPAYGFRVTTTLMQGSILSYSTRAASVATEGEVLGVLAHEIGHALHRHPSQKLAIGGMILLLTILAFSRLPSRLPFGVLAIVAVVVALLSLLIQRAYSRHLERQADSFAVATVGHEATTMGLRFLGRIGGSVPGCSHATWADTHDSIEERIARL